MVDRNRYRRDPAFLADPGIAHGEPLRGALAAHGVRVVGPTVHGSAPDGGSRRGVAHVGAGVGAR